MPDEFVVEQCSPTLAGLKTGNLFSYPLTDRQELTESLRRLNARLVPRGARILPVKFTQDRVLLYLYRPKQLERDLTDETAAAILAEKSYPLGCPEQCVGELIRRLKTEGDFPHEIGLFLGYPPGDVDGFMHLGARRAKCVGTWRVYGNEAAARKRFALYKKCTRLYQAAFRKHNSLDRLIVSQA